MRWGCERSRRINGLLTNLAIKAGYKDLSSFRAALNSDPKYIPKSADQIVEDFRRYVGQMQPRLPELFGVFPKTPLTVEAAPASQPNNPTHYIFGTPDGTRPARVVVATSNYAHRKLLPTKLRLTTKVSPAIICRFQSSSGSPACRSFVFTS